MPSASGNETGGRSGDAVRGDVERDSELEPRSMPRCASPAFSRMFSHTVARCKLPKSATMGTEVSLVRACNSEFETRVGV